MSALCVAVCLYGRQRTARGRVKARGLQPRGSRGQNPGVCTSLFADASSLGQYTVISEYALGPKWTSRDSTIVAPPSKLIVMRASARAEESPGPEKNVALPIWTMDPWHPV
eukprot:scaffold7979_cov417-Prasinococcus_capsulatus_cf.AAC.5